MSAGPLIGLASHAPSMDGERLKLSMIGFANRCQSNHRDSQRASCTLRFYGSVFGLVFQRSLNQAASLSIQMSGNFVRGHGLTSLKEWLIVPVMRLY